MSWFSNLESSVKGLTTQMGQLQGTLTEKVQKAVDQNKDLLEKLTLSTPELTAERQRIDAEEVRKEQGRNMLAGMLPWETRDSDRDILVEECKEAILQLSHHKETFQGPYAMPEAAVNLSNNKKKKSSVDGVSSSDGHDAEDHGDEHNSNDDGQNEHEEEEEERVKDMRGSKPTQDSLEKLAKLEPLPPLLADFDLNAHVGLIKRLLKLDPSLVQMQSSLSGGGERERVFWHNYFFHCAYTRYEAGLSIDEIWSDQPAVAPSGISIEQDIAAAAGGGGGAAATGDHADEETIVFHHDNKHLGDVDNGAVMTSSVSGAGVDGKTKDGGLNMNSTNSLTREGVSSSPTDGTDFEMVGGPDADLGSSEGNPIDYELDELEAEIARELED